MDIVSARPLVAAPVDPAGAAGAAPGAGTQLPRRTAIRVRIASRSGFMLVPPSVLPASVPQLAGVVNP
jgi:hypothetical protein